MGCITSALKCCCDQEPFDRVLTDDPERSSTSRQRRLHPSCASKQQNIYLGMSVLDLKTSSPSTAVLPELKTTHRHTVLLPGNNDNAGCLQGALAEPRDHVLLPFSTDTPGKRSQEPQLKWQEICKALIKPIKSFRDLQTVILRCSGSDIDLRGLGAFLETSLNQVEKADFYLCVLPKMAKLCLKLPKLFDQSIPVLRSGSPHSITMSQEQAACLLANAFFCTFPERNSNHRRSNIPGLNFIGLFCSGIQQSRREKLMCLYHYFKTVTENMPQGNLTYSRQMLSGQELPKWKKQDEVFPQLHVSSGGTIEEDGYGMLQVDFANKYIGGGVLQDGCVQEEIRFVICPELLVSLLFTEVLEPNEAVVITGPERFSKYTGYARSFAWGGNYIDNTPRDSWGRRCTQVVAIDAINVQGNLNSQFTSQHMKRELNKAYVGFYDPYNQDFKTAVATGNWGCGAFGGDGRLKALIQLMAAAVAGRDVCYFTYHDDALAQDIYDIHKLITERSLTVGDVWTLISDYQPCYSPFGRQQNVFMYIEDRAKSSPLLATPPVNHHTVRINLDPKEHNDDEDVWNQTSKDGKGTNDEDNTKGTGDSYERMGDW